jgi:hypothetical protein
MEVLPRAMEASAQHPLDLMDDRSLQVSARLFRAFANPRCVDYTVLRPVPPGARFPRQRPPDGGAVEESSVTPSLVDEAAAFAALAQARALQVASRSIVEAAQRLFPRAVESARARVGWPSAPLECHRPGARGVPYVDAPSSPPSEPVAPAHPPDPRPTDDAPKVVDAGRARFNIARHDPRGRFPGRVHMIVGKRGTGKNILLKDLIASSPTEWDCVAGMSPTPDSADMMREIMPPSCVYDGYDPDALERIIEMLRIHDHNGIRTRAMLVLDDRTLDSKVLRSAIMRDLFSIGRHLGLDVYLMCQYTENIPKHIRDLTDYVYALREPQKEYRRNLYKNYFGVFGTYARFSKVLDACTADYGCMVLDNTTKSIDVEDRVFWHRARTDHPEDELVVGSYDQWLLHHAFYREPDYRIGGDDGGGRNGHEWMWSEPATLPGAPLVGRNKKRKTDLSGPSGAIVVILPHPLKCTFSGPGGGEKKR